MYILKGRDEIKMEMSSVTIVVGILLIMICIAISGWGAWLYAFGNRGSLKTGHREMDNLKIRAGLRIPGFNRQKYIANHIEIYGVSNMGVSIDERTIHTYPYESTGIEDDLS